MIHVCLMPASIIAFWTWSSVGSFPEAVWIGASLTSYTCPPALQHIIVTRTSDARTIPDAICFMITPPENQCGVNVCRDKRAWTGSGSNCLQPITSYEWPHPTVESSWHNFHESSVLSRHIL